MGELQAWNLNTGERIWTQEFPTRVGSVLATAGDLVFADSGGTFRAFDALSGELLWEYAMERHSTSGVSMSYSVGGVQYVALQFRSRFEFPGAGDVVVAFRIDCQC